MVRLPHTPAPPPPRLRFPSRTDFSIKFQLLKLVSPYSPHSPPSTRTHLRVLQLAQWMSAQWVQALLKSQLLLADWQQAAELRIISWGFLKTPPVMFSQVRRNQDALQFSTGWRGGAVWHSHFKVSWYTHWLSLSGLKSAALTRPKPSHGGSAVTSQEIKSRVKPEPPSSHVLSVCEWISSHRQRTWR